MSELFQLTPSHLRCFASLLEATLYAQLTVCFFSGLKGQYNSAQGIVSGGTNRNAAVRLSSRRSLGKGCRIKTVREDSVNKANNSPRTELSLRNPRSELSDIVFGKHKVISLVRNKIFSFYERYYADNFDICFPTQGASRVLGIALGYYILAFQAVLLSLSQSFPFQKDM